MGTGRRGDGNSAVCGIVYCREAWAGKLSCLHLGWKRLFSSHFPHTNVQMAGELCAQLSQLPRPSSPPHSSHPTAGLGEGKGLGRETTSPTGSYCFRHVIVVTGLAPHVSSSRVLDHKVVPPVYILLHTSHKCVPSYVRHYLVDNIFSRVASNDLDFVFREIWQNFDDVKRRILRNINFAKIN